MSRSALCRQEGNKKRREKEAEDLFTMAVEEGRVSEKIKDIIDYYCDIIESALDALLFYHDFSNQSLESFCIE
jgi:hypothetical protein